MMLLLVWENFENCRADTKFEIPEKEKESD